MSLFDMFRAKVIYIVSANTFDAVIDWGFYTTIKKRFHLTDMEYNPNLPPEEVLKLKESKKKLGELIQGKEVIVRVHKTNIMEKWVADVYIPAMGVPDCEKAMEKTPAGEYVNVRTYLINKGYLKS